MSSDQESILIKQIKRGNKLAFDNLYHVYFDKLFGFAFKLTQSREDAEEIVQEVFIKIWELRDELDENKNFASLLFVMAKHKIYNKARRRVHEYAYQNYYQQTHQQAITTVEHQIDYLETKQFLDAAIQHLPAKRKEIFIMSRKEGLSNKEIAEKLNTSTSNIENHINKALKSLKSYLARQEINFLFIFYLIC